MREARARRNHVAAGRKRAAVCSRPPSWVGTGIIVSGSSSWPLEDEDGRFLGVLLRGSR
jgi:hypothetical protein